MRVSARLNLHIASKLNDEIYWVGINLRPVARSDQAPPGSKVFSADDWLAKRMREKKHTKAAHAELHMLSNMLKQREY
jgi:hypothetical protein